MRVTKYEIYLEKAKAWNVSEEYITTPDNFYRFACDYLKMSARDREVFAVAAVDNKARIIGVTEASIGDLSHTVVHPREVLKFAILANAAGIIVTHNHPSGDVTPSRDDIETTKKLFSACELIGIRLLDHIIVAEKHYCSMRDRGLL